MKVELIDNSIFANIELRITAENTSEIWGLIATFNTPSALRVKSFPDTAADFTDNYKDDAIEAVELPLWIAVSPIYKKLEGL